MLFLLIVGIRAVRKDRSSFQGRVLLAVALFSLGLVPQGMQRVDSAHFAWVSCVPFAFVPVAVLHLWRTRSPEQSYRRQAILSGGGVFLVMLLAIPQFTGWAYTDYVAQTFGKHRLVFPITRNGRTFYYGRLEVADAARRAARRGAEDREARRPALRRDDGPAQDPALGGVPLLPAARVPTGDVLHRDGSGGGERQGLAPRVGSRSADIAILSGAWNDWDEPNDSRKLGSDKPNQVLARDFCLVGSYGIYRTGDPLYELLKRRPAGQPCPPGTATPKPKGIRPGRSPLCDNPSPARWRHNWAGSWESATIMRSRPLFMMLTNAVAPRTTEHASLTSAVFPSDSGSRCSARRTRVGTRRRRCRRPR